MTNVDVTDAISLGTGQPLAVIAGPCVIESQTLCEEIAGHMQAVCQRLELPFVFKASFDKANRTSGSAFRGPGLDDGLTILQGIRDSLGVPVTTDIHEVGQVAAVAEVADILQIPAFLCRQTDLLLAAAATGRTVNIKKGQFLAPDDMAPAVGKVHDAGNPRALLTERGTTFGYRNLVVDMRGLMIMRELGVPVVFDATHSVQLPGGKGNATGGQRQFAPGLLRAAAAVGIDGVFVEVHPDPDRALSDGPNAIHLANAEAVLTAARDIHRLHASLPLS
jgi:2-dehydro-3-deoxyphosphooctonate aldolase (KDO 8-P synthase)